MAAMGKNSIGAHNYGRSGNVLGDNCISSDGSTTADADTTQDFRSGTDVNAIFNLWCSACEIASVQSDLVTYDHVASQ
jgi:hypothetical protein